jgi:hypothetical protein
MEIQQTLRVFHNEALNFLATQLIELDNEYNVQANNAEKALYGAFRARWYYGKLIYDNYEDIVKECGSQKAFAESIGKSEAYVSNNKRGYVYLLNEGCETWEDVVYILQNKKIKPIISNFEKIGALLNEPEKETHYLQQEEKDLKRLEKLREEAQEILQRIEPAKHPVGAMHAKEASEDLEEIVTYVKSFIPEHMLWENEKYLNHVRNFGKCLITGTPADVLDAHHTTMDGGVGPMGGKLADFFAIPVLREIHVDIEEGRLVPDPIVILRAQFLCLSSFITLNFK